MKKKHVAGILAFFFGMFGVHRFYLGQRFLGALYLFIFFFTMMITIEEGAPAVMVPAILAFIDAILLWVMPKEDFDDRYNKKRMRASGKQATKRANRQTAKSRNRNISVSSELQVIKKKGIDLFRDYEFEEAIEYFLEALELAPDDPSLHFNLACCYSMVEKADMAFQHLAASVSNGFDASKKIQSHNALAYLRTHPEFDQFVANGYKVVKALPTPEENLLEQKSPTSDSEIDISDMFDEEGDDLLSQISKLGDLLDKGILTQEEFAVQKQKLLED